MLGFTPAALRVALAGIRELRKETLGSPAKKPDSSHGRTDTSDWMHDLQQLLRAHLRPALQPPEPSKPNSAGDRAALLLAKLLQRSAQERRALVEEATDFQSEALAVLLCAKSLELTPRAPGEAIELAQLAVDIAEAVPGDRRRRECLQGYTWAHLGNALRVSSDLPGADQSFNRAAELWQGSTGIGSLHGSLLLELEASLRIDQGRPNQALALLDRALESGADPVRILLNKARALLDFGHCDDGHCERAMAAVEEAATLIDGTAQPRLLFIHRLLVAHCLCELRRYAEADTVANEARRLVEPLGCDLDLVRVQWLKGRVAASLGRVDEAIASLSEVRNRFVACDVNYDAALASLELATLLAPAGRVAEAQALARESAAVFCAQRTHREALAAFELLRQAAG